MVSKGGTNMRIQNVDEYETKYEYECDNIETSENDTDTKEFSAVVDGFYLESHLNNINERKELADIEAQKKMIEYACSDDLFIAKKYREQCSEQFHFFIIKLLNQYWANHMKKAEIREELIAEGHAAMLEALPRYNPSLGSPTNFLTPYIRHAAKEYIDRMIHHSTPYEANNWKKVNNSIEKLTREYGRVPSDVDIFYDTGLSLGVIRKSLTKRQFVSLDECSDVADDYDNSPEEVVVAQQYRQQMLEVLDQVLSPDEFTYVKYRYGFSSLGVLNKNEIRERMNWSASTINRIHENVMKIFKNTRLFQSLSNTVFTPKKWDLFEEGCSSNVAFGASDALIEDIMFTDGDIV